MFPYYLGRPEMGLAMEAAYCAKDQGKFFEYEHALYEVQGQIDYSPNSLVDLGVSIGLDGDPLRTCIANRNYRDMVDNGRRAATQRGINSTPTFYINNQRVEGNQPYDNLQRVIEQELAIAQ